MFSGIVETVGKVLDIREKNNCKTFTILPNRTRYRLELGDSVAINGVCLTVVNRQENKFTVTAVPETLRLTNLNKLAKNALVNLERAVQVKQRLGGHIVQGHVDGIGEIIEWTKEVQGAIVAKITIPPKFAKYIVNKGSITLDGMSMTVIEANENWITVTFIPHTQQVTIVNQYDYGTLINLEVDVFAKYIEKLVGVKE